MHIYSEYYICGVLLGKKMVPCWKFNPSGHFNVLIADDEKFIRILLIQILSKLIQKNQLCSMTIQTVRSAEEACRAVNNGKEFDLIFMDEHFTTTVGKTSKCYKDPSTLTLSASANMMTAVKDFITSEQFNSREHDGILRGSEFITSYKGTAACVVATGSPVAALKEHVSILKPFNVETLILAMENGLRTSEPLQKRLVQLGTTMRLKCNLDAILFTHA